MSKVKGFSKELGDHKLIYIFLFLSIIVGAFLRLYHHSDWLHFELDQARDLFVVYDMLNNHVVPLLGPYARGSDLYLGPIFYYFQALPAFVFGVAPNVAAWPDLLFSVLFIPLVYLFARLYFSCSVSVMLAVLAATSLFLVTYGRFAWNPNALPFWMTLAMYGLLRAHSGKTFSRGWFLTMIGAGIVAMQLHFIAFLVVPLTIGTYMLIARMRIPWRSVLLGVVLASLLYLPVLISEYQTHGANARVLVATIFAKGDKDNKHNLAEKVFRGVQETATYNGVLLSSDQSGGDPVRTKRDKGGHLSLLCDADCKDRFPQQLIAVSVFLLILGLFIGQFIISYHKRVTTTENMLVYQRQLLILLWLSWSGVFLVLLAYQISPRFYLLIVPALLIMFGFVLRILVQKWSAVGKWIGIVLVSLLVLWNLINTHQYFQILNSVEENIVQYEWRDLIMNRGDYITLGQLRSVADQITEDEKNSVSFLIVGDNRYARALYYLTNIEKNVKNAQCYIKRSSFTSEQVAQREYYVLVRTQSKTQINEEMLRGHTIADKKNFGTLTLYKVIPNKGGNISLEQPENCFVR